MPIFTIVDGRLMPLGTAFIIAPNGLLMTARHVVEAAYATRTRRMGETASFTIITKLYVLYRNNDPGGLPGTTHGGLWPITQIWCSNETDIALCWLWPLFKGEEPVNYPSLRLSPGLPNVGQKVLGLGYHAMEAAVSNDSAGVMVVDYSEELAHASGVIIEIHPRRRDSAMLRFPCFRTDARFESGMSGGPVFNEVGYVCGVICSSMAPIEDDPCYISYASLLWIMMGCEIQIAGTSGGSPENVTLYDLALRGYIATDASIQNVTGAIDGDHKAQVSIRR